MSKGHWLWDGRMGEGGRAGVSGNCVVERTAGLSEELTHAHIRELASREVHAHQRHTEKTISVSS